MIAAPDAAAYWWRDLQPSDKQRGDRAALARLRRCAVVAEAMQEPATISLFQQVEASGPQDLPCVALAAAVLAHVKDDMLGTVARAIGPNSPDKPETAKLKQRRFQRLIEAEGDDERLMMFRRLAALAGGKLPVADLSGALLDWSESRRRRWILDYWDADKPAAVAVNASSVSILAEEPSP